MTTASRSPTAKPIGADGRASLGKHDAPHQRLVEGREPCVWTARAAAVMPDNERWLHEPQATTDLQAALEWSATHSPSDADIDRVMSSLARGK